MIYISIITINLNNQAGLEKTIASVIEQSNKIFEFIIIDGKSTDGSVELIKKYSTHIHYWVSEKDAGIYDAMNKGITNSLGKYLFFLNSGDTIHNNDVLNQCIKQIDKHKDIDIFYGDIADSVNGKETKWAHPRDLTISFFKNNNLCHQSALAKADLFKEFGLYPAEYKLAGDHWMFLISFVNDKKFMFLEKLLINYQLDGLSSRNRATYDKEMAQIWQKLVPKYVNNLVNNYLHIEYANNYPFLKKIIPLHNIIIYKKKEIIISIITFLAIILFFVKK